MPICRSQAGKKWALAVLVRRPASPRCGGLQRIVDGTGEIKRMWIDPDWRGLGLGRRLLLRLEEVARALGYRRVVLGTNATLLGAMTM